MARDARNAPQSAVKQCVDTDNGAIGYGCEVKPSLIPSAGRGLFTCRSVAAGKLITQYDGEIISFEEGRILQQQGGHSHIRSLVPQHTCISGLQEPLPGRGGGSFANHSTEFRNAQFKKLLKDGCKEEIWLVATQDVSGGSEIYLDYGETGNPMRHPSLHRAKSRKRPEVIRYHFLKHKPMTFDDVVKVAKEAVGLNGPMTPQISKAIYAEIETEHAGQSMFGSVIFFRLDRSCQRGEWDEGDIKKRSSNGKKINIRSRSDNSIIWMPLHLFVCVKTTWKRYLISDNDEQDSDEEGQDYDSVLIDEPVPAKAHSPRLHNISGNKRRFSESSEPVDVSVDDTVRRTESQL